MPHEKVGRLKEVLRVLHDEAEELLDKHEVYEMLSRGWADEETPDGNYFGLAMWQINPPFKHDWATFMGGRIPSYAPTEKDEILLANGEDFTGAMLFARRSLGMALCFATISDPNLIGENDEFWHEYATTLQWLNIASDRLRDFFLMARFGQTKQKYKKQSVKHWKKQPQQEKCTKGPEPYSQPFKTAVQGAASDLQGCLVELAKLAEELEKHREERNDLVHKIATASAKRSVSLLREQRRLAGAKAQTSNGTDEKLSQANAKDHEASEGETLPQAVEAMKLWYERLVRAGNLVFEFEYLDRQK